MATSSNGTKDQDAGKKPESVDEEADEKDEGAEEEAEGGDEGEEEEAGGDEEEAAARAKDEEDTVPEEAKAPAKASAARDSRPSVDRALRAVPVKQVSASPPTAGLGKSVMLFVVVVGGLSLLMVLLGNEKGNQPAAPPKWSDGQVVDLDITLVKTDQQDLACASGTEVGGLHCMYESQGKRWSKGDANDDKKTLRPYSTTANVNFLAAGIWSEPALAPDKLPNARFTLKCKYKVAGKMPRADVRWHEGEGWNNVTDWYTGAVSDCKLGNVQN